MTAYISTMPPQDFDLYTSNDQDAFLMATSQAFGMPNTFLDPFASTMSALDNSTSLQAPTHMSQPGDFISSTQAMHMKHGYSPRASPPLHAYHGLGPQPSNGAEPTLSSGHSSSNSTLGSPAHQMQQQVQYSDHWGLGLSQTIVPQQTYATSALEQDLDKQAGFVDPTLINPFNSPSLYSNAMFGHIPATVSPHPPFVEHPPSPAPSSGSSRSHNAASQRFKPAGSQSPYLHAYTHQPYPQQYPGNRRSSQASIHSRHSQSSHRSNSYELDDETAQRGLCPIADCGRVFKDLKAHMLTHQNERPEKCPIVSCEYHIKGFARKYDKNRHTLTHYKGTMVCGFCPGSGSAAEKSFNRADVFKRHLTSVHGVEQTPPNSRKKSPTSKGKMAIDSKPGVCSTCSVLFANVQDFYEHLDDCVMRQVQQADPYEASNQKNLESVQDDARVQETLERHNLPSTSDYTGQESYDDVDEEDDSEATGDVDENDNYGVSRNSKSGKGAVKSRKDGSSCQSAHPRGVGASSLHAGGGSSNRIEKSRSASAVRRGLTFSKGGVALSGPLSGRKKRKHYPSSWGCNTDKMRMKKRVLCVYDGPRRLWKDDMMLDSEFEVRLPLVDHTDPTARCYVTDLDVQTLKRAEALHGTTAEERGEWHPDNVFPVSGDFVPGAAPILV